MENYSKPALWGRFVSVQILATKKVKQKTSNTITIQRVELKHGRRLALVNKFCAAPAQISFMIKWNVVVFFYLSFLAGAQTAHKHGERKMGCFIQCLQSTKLNRTKHNFLPLFWDQCRHWQMLCPVFLWPVWRRSRTRGPFSGTTLLDSINLTRHKHTLSLVLPSGKTTIKVW